MVATLSIVSVSSRWHMAPARPHLSVHVLCAAMSKQLNATMCGVVGSRVMGWLQLCEWLHSDVRTVATVKRMHTRSVAEQVLGA